MEGYSNLETIYASVKLSSLTSTIRINKDRLGRGAGKYRQDERMRMFDSNNSARRICKVISEQLTKRSLDPVVRVSKVQGNETGKENSRMASNISITRMPKRRKMKSPRTKNNSAFI